MSEAKHTPTPWVHYDDRDSTGRQELQAMGRTIARSYYKDEQAAHDFALMSRAVNSHAELVAAGDRLANAAAAISPTAPSSAQIDGLHGAIENWEFVLARAKVQP